MLMGLDDRILAITTSEPTLIAKLCPLKPRVFVARRWTLWGTMRTLNVETEHFNIYI